MNESITMDDCRQPANEVASSAYNLSRNCLSTAVAAAGSSDGLAVAVAVAVDDADKERANGSPASRSSNNIRHWQTSKKTVKERVEFMFNNEHLADVFFIVGRGASAQRIPAHKFVLSVSSAVFDAMFNSMLSTDSDQIEIPDVEPAAFFALLKFLYSDNVHIEPDTVMSTLYTAKKYAVPSLESCCVEFLERNLTSDNAFMLLSQARLFDEPRLADLCLKMIDKHTVDALAADGFTDIDLETLCCVLARDTLRIKEGKLFQAVVRWSEAECARNGLSATSENQRKVATSALKLIRFPLLTVEEFASGPAQSGLLEDKDIVSLFLYFIVNPKPQTEYVATARSIMTGSELFVNRFPQLEMRWGYSGTCDRIKFTVDHQIFVIGFGLYGSVHTPHEYGVCIELIKTSTNKVIGRNDTTFTSDGSRSIFRIMFEEPVLIMPNISYIASATIKGPDSHYGTKGMRKVCVETPSGKITFQFSYSSGNNNGSSVEDGQIPQILFYV